VETKTFKNKRIFEDSKVTYSERGREDTWYFYFDPPTYAMEVLSILPFDESKKMGSIYHFQAKEIIKMTLKCPRDRAWYYNKKDQYFRNRLSWVKIPFNLSIRVHFVYNNFQKLLWQAKGLMFYPIMLCPNKNVEDIS